MILMEINELVCVLLLLTKYWYCETIPDDYSAIITSIIE